MRWPDLAAATAHARSSLDPSLRLATVTEPLPLDRLSPGEARAWAALPESPRRDAWLLGRAALKRLLGPVDTTTIGFPNPLVSLTHAAGTAIAAGCHGDHQGIGVDFEGRRECDPRAARFFLDDSERGRLGPAWAGGLIRLWTVKEALYKATPDNAEADLLACRLDDPTATTGTATDGRGHTFRYVSGWLPAGPLAVAVCEGGAGGAV